MTRHVVGRADELAELDRALDGVAGAHRVVELVGEPGMGKTTLLAELRSRAEQRGFVVLGGQATEFERLPYAVFVDALDDHLGTVDPERLAELGADWLELLSAVFPALAMGRAVRPSLAAAERHVLYRAVRALVARLHTGSGVALLLDDLHWADEASAELLDHLLRHPPGDTPLLLALSYRPRQLPDRLATAFAGHTDQPWWHRTDVCPLSFTDVAELCGESVPPARRQDLYQASGGNPYYLEALIRTGPPWRPDPFGDHDLQHDLRRSVWAALLREVSGLSEDARVIAQGAAVLGEVFEVSLVAPVARTTDANVLAVLDDLLARDLVRPADAPQRLRFRHPLLRSVLYGTAPYGWRLGAHARAAHALAEHGASLSAQAIHVERAARIGDDDAVAVLVSAATQVMPLAPGRAAHWLRQALRLLADRAGSRPELWLGLAHTLGVAGELVESRDILLESLDVLPVGPGEHRLTAVTSLAMVQRLLGQHTDARTLLLAELAADGNHAGLELELAAGAMRGSDFDGAVEWGVKALASATADHDDRRVTTATALLALAHVFAGATGPSATRLAEAVRVVDTEPDRTLATHLDAIMWAGWAEVFLERYADALRHLGRCLDLARRTGQSYVLADTLVGITYAHLWSGSLAEAGAATEDAVEAAIAVGSDELRTMAASVGVGITLWSGDMVSALQAAEKATSEIGTATGRGPTIATAMLAQARLLNGDGERAGQTLLDAGGGDELPRFEFPTRAPWFRMLVSVDLLRGDPAGAWRWVGRAEAAADATGLHGQRGHALLARSTALGAEGDRAGAAACAATAATEFACVGMRLYQAQAHMMAGGSHAAANDRLAAISAFGQAKALFTACGADNLRRQADVAQRGLGGRTPRASTRSADTQALSEREQQIADLVAEGRTNRQIAEKLFMSPRTVEVHLTRIFGKLGVSSRSAVAAVIASTSARHE